MQTSGVSLSAKAALNPRGVALDRQTGTLALSGGTITFTSSDGQQLVSVPISTITEVSRHPTRLEIMTEREEYRFIFAGENKHTAVGWALGRRFWTLTGLFGRDLMAKIEKNINTPAWVQAIQQANPGVRVRNGVVREYVRLGVVLTVLVVLLLLFVNLLR